MVAAWMLARTWKYVVNEEYLQAAREAMKYTCTRQLPNGSWYYGEEAKYHWIDNFHTGYNLDALKSYISLTNDRTYEEELRRGFSFYKGNFFEANGRPKYYHNKTYPIDSQCASQSIDTLTYFSDFDADALKLAAQVALWTIHNMQDRTGHFYFMRYPLMTLRAPMIHWAQATTYKALSSLLSKLKEA